MPKQLLRLSALIVGFLGFVCPPAISANSTAPATVAQADELEDLLQHRWFTIEYILFERLDVLDVNSSETLTQERPRQWPQRLATLTTNAPLRFVPSSTPATVAPDTSLTSDTASRLEDLAQQYPGPLAHRLTEASVTWIDQHQPDLELAYPLLDVPYTQCLGYPNTRIADPIHPALLPESPAQALARAAQALRDAEQNKSARPDTQEQLNSTLDADQAQVFEAQTEGDATTSVTTEATDLIVDNLPEPIEVDPVEVAAEALLEAVKAFEEDLADQQFQPQAELSLTQATKAINRRSKLRPLLHQRWLQAVPSRQAPIGVMLETPLTVDAGMTSNGLPKISGYLALTVSRYLHLSAQLWYHADTLGLRPVMLNQAPQLSPNAYFELRESRRMRSEELHYLDHPKFGLIVRVEPLTYPPALEAQFDATSKMLEERR